MDSKGLNRNLTAIPESNVPGYSPLAQNNDAVIASTLEAYKQFISDLIKQHRGRVENSPGDNLLTSLLPKRHCASA